MKRRRKKTPHALRGLLLVAALGGCARDLPRTAEEKHTRLEEMLVEIDRRFPGVEMTTVAEVGRLLEKDSVVLIDVREAREREVSMIPGAITAEEFEAHPDLYSDRAVVAYCTIGHRSSEYVQRLSADGREIRNLRGSLLAWTYAGGPLVSAEGPTRRLHVYGSSWNLAAEGYETIW